MKLRMPMGDILQGLTGAAWAFRTGKTLPDELAAQLNASSPTFADLCEKLFMECIHECREPGEEWQPLKVVPDDQETIVEEGIVTISDFEIGLDMEDLSALQSAIWDHNGLGKGFEAVLAPFREVGRAADRPDGESVLVPADRDSEAGPDELHAERGVPDGGGQRGGRSEEESAGEGGAEIEEHDE